MSDALQALERGLSVAAQKGDIEAARAITAEMQRLMKEVNPAVDAPVDRSVEAANMLAKETGAGEAIVIGAGRTADKVRAGVKQKFLDLPSYPLTQDLNKREETNLATEQAERDKAYAALRKKRPIATSGGEALPYIAVPTSGGPVAAGAVAGGVEASQYGTDKERTARGITGGLTTAAGGYVGNFMGRLLAPVKGKAASASGQAALDAAERIGVQPTLGEATGSTFLRRLEDLVARLPGGASVMAEHQAGNATALNRAAARAIGEEADELTPEVFARAAGRLGKVFEDIKATGQKAVQVGPDVGAAADEVLRKQAKMLPHQQDQNLIDLAKRAKWASQNRGWIDGETYQLMRSGLSDAAFDATVGTNKHLYGRLLESLDDSAEASLRAAGNDALADALRTARPQYANLKILEKGATAEAGNVSPAKVASTMRTNNPGAFRRGRFVGSDMGDIAAVGENLKPLRAGSPTVEREVMSNPVAAAFHWLWSKPTASALTSPAATLYPRTLGNTKGARALAEIANPTTRAAVAAALAESGALPLLPVTAE